MAEGLENYHNKVELLTYETVSEALHVATRMAQSDEHGQFVLRMSQSVSVLSDSGRCVLERIARCGEGRVRSTAEGRYKVERTRCGCRCAQPAGQKGEIGWHQSFDQMVSKPKHLTDSMQ